MQSEDDSLWESFPQALETLEGARRYINAFRAPLQELNNLNSNQVHALRACSVLAIPPSTERMPPSGGFPKDLSELNLSGWAALVQDVVTGLWPVPPNLLLDVGLPAMILLQLLEETTRVGFCHFCCHPSPQCKCMGAYQQAPTKTWSQVVEQIPGYGVAQPLLVLPLQRCLDMWHLHWASPFQISLFGACPPPLRFHHPGDYPWLHRACPALGGLI